MKLLILLIKKGYYIIVQDSRNTLKGLKVCLSKVLVNSILTDLREFVLKFLMKEIKYLDSDFLSDY